MRTSKSSSKRGTGRTIDTKLTVDITLPDSCAVSLVPITGHTTKSLGFGAYGEILYCLICKCIVGTKANRVPIGRKDGR